MLSSEIVKRTIITVLVLTGLFANLAPALAAWVPQPAHLIWVGKDGTPLPFRTEEEVLEFLRTAEVTSTKRTGEGINNPWIVELEQDEVRARACFRDVSVVNKQIRTAAGFQLNLRDDAIFEVAAYELARLLGIPSIPPVVKRRILKREGTLQLWVENAMTEGSRLAQGLKPTDLHKWRCQYEMMLLFDALIFNDDRNQGNILFDKGWNRWLIDHTRSFRVTKQLIGPEKITRCDRKIWEKLGKLDKALLEDKLGDYLRKRQIESILDRRDQLLDHLQARIDKYGQSAVLVQIPDTLQ